MTYAKMLPSYDELCHSLARKNSIIQQQSLRIAELEKQLNEFSTISMQQAEASDKMKWELITSGLLNTNKIKE